MPRTLADHLAALGAHPEPDAVLDAFTSWAEGRGLALYPAQEEAVLEIMGGANVILGTPTGFGEVARGAGRPRRRPGRRDAHVLHGADQGAGVGEVLRPVHELGSDHVGMLTGDAAVNPDAPVICCTAEILANLALRDGEQADVGQVVMDEFHYYADPDRGWAWQVPLLTLPQAQFVLMSATLGDTRRFEAELSERTGRPTAAIRNATRPVPLDYEYRHTAHARDDRRPAGHRPGAGLRRALHPAARRSSGPSR